MDGASSDNRSYTLRFLFSKNRLNTLELEKPKHFYYFSKPTRVKISYKNVYFKTSLIAFLRRERFLICFKYCLLSEGLAILFLMYIQVILLSTDYKSPDWCERYKLNTDDLV